VAITTTFYVVNLPVNQIVEFIREHNNQVKIILGGPPIAYHARNYHGDEFKTAIEDIGSIRIEGQGHTFADRGCLKNGGSLSAVPILPTLRMARFAHKLLALENSLRSQCEQEFDATGIPTGHGALR